MGVFRHKIIATIQAYDLGVQIHGDKFEEAHGVPASYSGISLHGPDQQAIANQFAPAATAGTAVTGTAAHSACPAADSTGQVQPQSNNAGLPLLWTALGLIAVALLVVIAYRLGRASAVRT